LALTGRWLAGALLVGTAWAQDAGAPEGELRECFTPTWRTPGTANEPRTLSVDLSDRIDEGAVVLGGQLRLVFDFVPETVQADQISFRIAGGTWNEFDAVECTGRDPCVSEAVAALDLDRIDFTAGEVALDVAQFGGSPLPVREACVVLAVSPTIAPADTDDGASADEDGCQTAPGAPLAFPGALLALARRRKKR
jgi:uncharacterized protein (TIGR03382 family)